MNLDGMCEGEIDRGIEGQILDDGLDVWDDGV